MLNKQRSAGSQKAASRVYQVNIQNVSTLPDVYLISPERFAAAADRHQKVRDLIEVRIGSDYIGLEKALESAEVLVGPLMSGNMPREVVARAPRLRWVHHIGAGVDKLVPLDWLPPGAVLTKSTGAHLPNAAEYAIMAIMMLNHRIPFCVSRQREHRWERFFSTSLRDKTLAIVGVGAIGGAVAAEAKKLGLRVVGVRRSVQPRDHVDEMFPPEHVDRALSQADFVFVSTVLTRHNHGLIGRKAFESMKKGAGFVSISRAPVLDWEALGDALKQGHLSGAVVNSFDVEPLPEASPIWDFPNLIMTPHIGTQDQHQYTERVLDIFFTNMQRYISGEPLLFQIDSALGY